MLFKISLLLVLLVSVVQSHKGIDISRLYNQSVYECFKKDGFSFAIPRAFHSYGAVDANAIQNLKNAKAAGLSTDVYLFPCKGKSATAQANEMISGIPTNLYGMIWIDI